MKKDSTIQNVVFVALFAALTLIATQFIRIPMPTGAFVHMGNAVLLLAVLLLGYVRGSLAGGIGFFLFDIFNGYATEAPYFILESFIVGGAAYLAFKAFNKNLNTIPKVFAVGIVTGIAKLGMTFLKNLVTQLVILGAGFNTSLAASIAILPATIINVATTIVVVSLVYFPLKKSMESLVHHLA